MTRSSLAAELLLLLVLLGSGNQSRTQRVLGLQQPLARSQIRSRNLPVRGQPRLAGSESQIPTPLEEVLEQKLG